MPVVIRRWRQGVVCVGKTAVVRSDGRTVVGDCAAKACDDGVGVECG